jgi:hypothetical protein
MNDREITQPIAEAITLTFDAPVNEVLTANLDSDGVLFGQIMSGGNFYSYIADSNTITTYYHPEETEYLNEYAHAVLDNMGIHTDAWETYDYALGFFRVDAQMKCKPGNKPCGRRCIPQQMKCRSAMGGGAQAKMRQGRANLRAPGAGAIAAGVVGAAALAAGGAAAYQNREEIAKGAKKIGRQVQKTALVAKREVEGKAAELASNVNKGVEVAKENIQQAAKKTGQAARIAGKKATRAVERTKKEVDKNYKETKKEVDKKYHETRKAAIRTAKEVGVAGKRLQKQAERKVAEVTKGAENTGKKIQQQARKSKKRGERYAADPERVQKVGKRLGDRWARNMGAK